MKARKRGSRLRVTQDQGMGYSAFIDLVGIRALAERSAQDYYARLAGFHSRVWQRSHVLRKGHVYFFSDCAYIECESATYLIEYLRELRNQMFIDGYYFRGAVGSFVLEAKSAAQLEFSGSTDSKFVTGHYFGMGAAQLFGLQERFKGIGFYVDESIATALSEASRQKYLVNACYVTQSNTRESVAYTDISLSRDELKFENLERVVKHLLAAKSLSKRLGRYYISLLVVWIQSIKWSDQEVVDPKCSRNVFSLVFNGEFYRLLGDVVGVELVYFAAFDRLFREEGHGQVPNHFKDLATKFIRRNRKVLSRIEKVPTDLLNSDVQEKLFEQLHQRLFSNSTR